MATILVVEDDEHQRDDVETKIKLDEAGPNRRFPAFIDFLLLRVGIRGPKKTTDAQANQDECLLQ